MIDENQKWIDNSKVNCLKRCPREFYLRYILDLTREKTTIAQAFGQAFHEVLELALEHSISPSESLAFALDNWENILSKYYQELATEIPEDYLAEDYRFEPSTGILALQHLYSDAGAISQLLQLTLKVLGSEVPLVFPTTLDYKFLGLADIIVKTHSGDISLIDIKTTSWTIDAWATKVLVDTQLHSYALALTASGIRPQSAAFLVCQINRRRLKSGCWSDKPTLKSAIFPTAATQDHFNRMRTRISLAVLEIEGRLQTRSWPCTWDSCIRYNNLCPYLPLCERFWRGFDDSELLDTAFSLGFQRHKWFPFRNTDQKRVNLVDIEKNRKAKED